MRNDRATVNKKCPDLIEQGCKQRYKYFWILHFNFFRGVKESFPSQLKKEAAYEMLPSLCSPSPTPSPVEGEGTMVGACAPTSFQARQVFA